MNYIPIPGTNGYLETWTAEGSTFSRLMADAGCHAIRNGNRGYRWSGFLDGIDVVNQEWESSADSLGWFLQGVPYEDLNIIAHSHGGQIALIHAARGNRIRTLTTVGTPCREDIPIVQAEDHIGFHQHIYDTKLDVIAWLGQFRFGMRNLHMERALRDARILNIPRDDVRHSRVLMDDKYVPDWIKCGWVENMKRGRRL